MMVPIGVHFRKTSWGWIGLAASEKGIRAIALPTRTRSRAILSLERSLETSTLEWESNFQEARLIMAGGQIEEFLNGVRRRLHFPLDLSGGSPFRQSVWRAAQQIPYGSTRSYGWLAARIGRPGAARAVGGALGANPLPLVIPCHRVIRGDRSLGGFGGGLELKRRLLALERANHRL